MHVELDEIARLFLLTHFQLREFKAAVQSAGQQRNTKIQSKFTYMHALPPPINVILHIHEHLAQQYRCKVNMLTDESKLQEGVHR